MHGCNLVPRVCLLHAPDGKTRDPGYKVGMAVETSTALKRPRRFSFYLVGFYLNVKWNYEQGCIK